ncbi:MAG: FAD:protein FMN transferase [Bacilli bacterium]|nr:FAD:protein FMN transferase [Bacilli bacterium]
MKKRILALLPLFLLSSCVHGSGEEKKETLFDTKWAFGTGMSLTLAGSSKEVFNHVFQIFEDYSNLSDAYNSRVDENLKPIVNLAFINQDSNEGKEIEVDERLADMLKFGLEMQEKTSYIVNNKKEYYFDPLIGKIATLWKNFLETKDAPLPEESIIQELLEERKTSSYEVHGNIVKRTGKAKIDVGAFAKGYAVKVAQDYLREQGVKNYFINGGSSSMAIGFYNDTKPYKISIKSLRNAGYSEAYFLCSDTGVGTSGVSEQAKEYLGKEYSHIIDPRTGSGLAKNDTVSILCDNPAYADVLSTAIFVGGEGAAKYLQKNFSFEYMIYDGTNVVSSEGMHFVLEK